MIRHLSALPVAILRIAMIKKTQGRALMPPTGGTKTDIAGFFLAPFAAVNLPVVTLAADEKHLTALGTSTDDESKRFQLAPAFSR